jgi:hypothetical protein
MCLDLIRNPVKAIESAKKERSMTKAVSIAILASVVFAIGVTILTITTLPAVAVATFAGMFFLFALVAILFSGLILQITANTLGGKGEYFEGLATMSHMALLMSIGFIISTIFSLVPFGVVVSVIIFGIFFALSISTLFRAAKELFKMDMITTFVAVIVLLLALVFALYLGGFGAIGLDKLMPMMQV